MTLTILARARLLGAGAAALALLSLSACDATDRGPSAAEIAAKIEPEVRGDIPEAERRAAAAAIARDLQGLIEDSREVAHAAPGAAEATVDAAIARECERLALATETLQRRATEREAGEPLTDAERAALPEELARTRASFDRSCAEPVADR